jgi:hypothetical protein
MNTSKLFFFATFFLAIFSCKKEVDTNPIPPIPANDQTCFTVSSSKIYIENFWSDGGSTSLSVGSGEVAFTSEITDLSSGEKITVKVTNIKRSGGISSFNANLNGGQFNNENFSYPTDKCP